MEKDEAIGVYGLHLASSYRDIQSYVCMMDERGGMFRSLSTVEHFQTAKLKRRRFSPLELPALLRFQERLIQFCVVERVWLLLRFWSLLVGSFTVEAYSSSDTVPPTHDH